MAEPQPRSHPLVEAVQPLVARVRGEVVAPDTMRSGDVPLRWEGELVAGVRLPGVDLAEGLGRLLTDVEQELDGGPLRDLSRADKQRAVRLLEERGAFHYRKSAESIAEALGVTRFTVYNYMNRSRG